MKYLSLVMILVGLSLSAEPAKRAGFNFEALESLAIQDRGRLKPMHTFATESVLFITGKRTWKDMSATEVLFGWLIAYDKEWEKEAFIKIDHTGLKKELGLDTSQKYFTPTQVQENEKFRAVMREAAKKEQRKERLSEVEKKAVQLQNQRGLLNAIVTGEAWAILPNPQGVDKDWFALAALSEQRDPLPYSGEQLQKFTDAMKALLQAFMSSDPKAWNDSVYQLSTVVRTEMSQGKYPPSAELQREIRYNEIRPFRLAWILYVVAFIILLLYNVTKNRVAHYGAIASTLIAFSVHIYGFVERCLIAGRPPVTNMYESVIWVTWGCVLFALIIWVIYKNAIIPNAALVFAIAGLVLADNLPLALDPSINPLEPVLRSNFWLTIHVLTITLSYAAFALSLCLGNVVLGNFLFRPAATETIQQYSLYMYRAIQIGVILIAAGTILGGVWADYSWGRFWGWDPKEVWALIALLLYLAVLHGRFTNLLRGFGFATATVMSFLGVLMAWYGVNFVLGVGLHSYGFGTGGIEWVLGYVLLQLGFIAAAYTRYAQVKRQRESEPGIFPRGT